MKKFYLFSALFVIVFVVWGMASLAMGGVFLSTEIDGQTFMEAAESSEMLTEPFFEDGVETDPASSFVSYITFVSSEHAEIGGPYDFSADLPVGWTPVWIPEIQSIEFVAEVLDEETGEFLPESMALVRSFEASEFLTLGTVDILSRKELVANGYDAVRYQIKKRPGVADFAYQPAWRNREHSVVDIRSSQVSPTLFYVFGFSPRVTDEMIDRFTRTFEHNPLESRVFQPIGDFYSRVTLKPFGIYIDRETSPVQPERFSGFHSGADVEFSDEAIDEVPVFAIADGVVRVARTATGYGGVVVIEHEIDGEVYSALYGHLDIASVRKQVGERVQGGEEIGILGEGYTPEADGERRHLHFSIYPGDNIDLRGYVSQEEMLGTWIDPVEFLQAQNARARAL